MTYDVIGDVHGRARPLRALLERLGYREFDGAYRHQDRRVVFMGDLVDRGRDVADVLSIAYAMEQARTADVILGNHEFNILCWYTLDPGGIPRRSYTADNEGTILLFNSHPALRERYLEWFRTLPLWLEAGGCRFVHAYWGNAGRLPLGGARTLLEAGWLTPHFRRTPIGRATDLLLKGPEVPLPDGLVVADRHGLERREARVAWWRLRPDAMRWPEFLSVNGAVVPDEDVPADLLGRFPAYAPDAPRLFIGHYGFRQAPYGERFPAHVTCVDFDPGDGTPGHRSFEG